MATAQPPVAKQGQSAKEASKSQNFYEKDFPYIRSASIMLAACLLFGAALVGTSSHFLNAQKKAKQEAQTQNSQAHEKYARSEAEKHGIRDAQPRYLELVKRGFVGNERRLNWVERIKAIQEKHRLLSISYEIFPQQTFQVDGAVDIGELELHGSKMQVKMDLLHDLDLLNFLEDLKAGEPYAPNDCLVKKTAGIALEPLAPRLTAECTFYWITLGPRTAEGADSSKPAQ